MYEKPQFEAAFQLITAISHQIIKIDFIEMEVWVDKLMGAEALNDPEVKKNHENLKGVLQAYTAMQRTLMQKGIPVRDIQHYKEAVGEAPPLEKQP